MLPFTSTHTVRNLLGIKLTEEKLSLLKYGLKHPIEPRFINKTDVLTIFVFIHGAMNKDPKDNRNVGEVKAKLSYLANLYVNSYKPTKNVLPKYRVLNKLRNNNDILITRPDKGNGGVVILDRRLCMSKIYDIVNDESEFWKLSSDPTLRREGKLLRFIRILKNKDFFTKERYDNIYHCGSQPARIYGTPKTHKLKSPMDTLTIRLIVSSIGTYNYNLAKFLVVMLDSRFRQNIVQKILFHFARKYKR